MKTYSDEKGNTVKARNYTEAAEKLYGQKWYRVDGQETLLPTTYCDRHLGYAEVKVYNVGDKQGSYWGVQSANPQEHTLKEVVI